ncbi:unnamed protein product, partial [Allacma fusca]
IETRRPPRSIHQPEVTRSVTTPEKEMAKQPVVGLGDVSFDPSLQTDEVDHDFFDNPASLPEPELPSMPSSRNPESQNDSSLKIGFPLAPIRIVTDSPVPCPDSNEMFSTGSLLACLNNPPTELSVEVNGSHLDYGSFRRNCSDNGNVNSPKSARNKKSKRQPRIKLFDISDSSSDESGGSDGSDEELNNFMEKYYNLLDVEDTDNSDITEVSPLSSLTVSPLPAFVGEVSGAEDSNHSLDGSSNNKYSGSHIFRSIAGADFPGIGMEKSVHESVAPVIPSIRQPLVINTGDAVGTNSFSGLFSESKDQNQNGDRSPSDSSCVSACGSTNISCASSISFTVSPKRSCCSSSTSSSCGSMGAKKSGRNFTFTPDQLKRIERENGILLKKILDVQRHSHHHHHLHHHGGHRGSHKNTAYRNMQCAATIARQKQQRKIDHDNLMLMKRLQTAKPSREIGEAFKNKNV